MFMVLVKEIKSPFGYRGFGINDDKYQYNYYLQPLLASKGGFKEVQSKIVVVVTQDMHHPNPVLLKVSTMATPRLPNQLCTSQCSQFQVSRVLH